MEEIQSTEVLDREILEDARRKAAKILKTADEGAEEIRRGWETRTLEAIAALRERHGRDLQRSREEVMARLPLDKKRNRLSLVEGLLRQAGRDFLSSLTPGEMLSLMEGEAEKRLQEFQDEASLSQGPIEVSYAGLSPKDVEALLKKLFPGTGQPAAPREDKGLSPEGFPLLICDTGLVRLTLSAEAAVEALLEDYRGEMAEALLGREVLDE